MTTYNNSNNNQNDRHRNTRRPLKPVPLLSGIEEIRQDLEERIAQGDTVYGIEILDEAVETIRKGSITFIVAEQNCLDLDTKVLTPSGFKPMRDITSDDRVIGADGLIYDIISITNTDEVDCYKLTTTDGRSIISSYNHNWRIWFNGYTDHNCKNLHRIEKVWNSERLSKELEKKHRRGRINLVSFNDTNDKEKALPINPYILGVLIGDGCLTCAGVRYCKPSKKVFDKVNKYLDGKGYARIASNKKDVIITDAKYISDYITNAGLRVHSYEKFIPDEYKYGLSRKQRELLLEGLLDTDGCQYKSYNEYSTTSERLANDIQELAWSLGYRCTIKSRMGRYLKDGTYINTRVNYRINISNRTSQASCKVSNCEYIGKRKTKCITTNAPNSLFVVENYIVTCNTGKSLIGQIVACNLAKQGKKVMICTCEMGAGLLMERQIKTLTGISAKKLKDLYEKQRDTANYVMDSLIEDKTYSYLNNIDICETGGAFIEDIIEMLDGFPEYEYVVVDYIQRIKGTGSEYENVTYASRELQTYARDTGKRIIVCSQAGRQSQNDAKYGKEKDGTRIKGKGSGSIEEDADVVITLMGIEESEGRKILITLTKNRYGHIKNITYKYSLDERLNLRLECRSA